MKVTELPTASIRAPVWNPNEMGEAMRARLRGSIQRFGLLVPLVVRSTGNGTYETVGGAQRLAAMRDMVMETVLAVVVDLDDSEARLLAQALNHIAGEDNPGLRAQLIRDLLSELPVEELLTVLPETHETLEALASLGQEDLATYLRAWQGARDGRLKSFTARLTPDQKALVDKVIGGFLTGITPGQDGNPNRKGVALYRLCLAYQELREACQ